MLAAVRETLRHGASHIKLAAGGGYSSPADPLLGNQFTYEEIKAAVDTAADWGTYVTIHAYIIVEVGPAGNVHTAASHCDGASIGLLTVRQAFSIFFKVVAFLVVCHSCNLGGYAADLGTRGNNVRTQSDSFSRLGRGSLSPTRAMTAESPISNNDIQLKIFVSESSGC